MERLFVWFVVVLTAASLIAGCSPSAPTSTPSSVGQPDTAPGSQRAEVPGSGQYPQKGRTITLVVPWPAGGTNDIFARLFATWMERDLGTPVQVANRPGAGGLTGMTEVARARADGYTVGMNSTPATVTAYLDPDRQSTFGRRDLVAVAAAVLEPFVLVARGGGPYKTAGDLVQAAGAAPEKVKLSDSGVLAPSHLAGILLQNAARVKFASVHFDGDPAAVTSILGGHTDAHVASPASVMPQLKSAALVGLGTTGKEESPFFPGVRPLRAQGYEVVMENSRGFVVPTGTPREIVDTLDRSIKRGVESDEVKKRMEETGLMLRYLNATEYSTDWDDLERKIRPLLQEAKTDQTKK